MGRRNKNNKKGKDNVKEKKKNYLLTLSTKRKIKAILVFLAAVIIALSFFDKAGSAGSFFKWLSEFLAGQAALSIPVFLAISGFIVLKSQKRNRVLVSLLAIAVLVVGIAGVLAARNLEELPGGWIGFLLAKVLVELFGGLVANIVFSAVILIGVFVFLQSSWHDLFKKKEEKEAEILSTKKEDVKLKIKGQEEESPEPPKKEAKKLFFGGRKKDEKPVEKLLPLPKAVSAAAGHYSLPPIDLLLKNETVPTAGNIKENSLIIKKTLENFGIPVEMTEVNIGPTVTQYAFKPAEGVKLSKITTLSNNLALALAAHPIRIEAPIPGKSLVGIEVPNAVRATVVLRNLIASPEYQRHPTLLSLALGKDVSGNAVYTDLAEMPHLLVAGATGTGKTIFLNSLVLSLLYKNTPETLKMIMVDPKRVEMQNYNEIPHLLCPVIYDAQKTMNALNWLTREMERRFQAFSEIPTRNIKTYNQNKSIIAAGRQFSYIILIVDELADLMAAKGKELEAGIVRLAQMARATGIHLVLATQRPSVEVITGLIKANITSRITFQVASQVDSRTILDTAGAEKLLGNGDMLFLSSKSAKISRVQTPYVSEKEVKRVTNWFAEQSKNIREEPQSALNESLKEALDRVSADSKRGDMFFGDEDPLFEDVKRIVLETKKASASFLQRRLRIGYARAARLIDMLEEHGVVGPAEGAKPREVYGGGVQAEFSDISAGEPEALGAKDENDGDWQKV